MFEMTPAGFDTTPEVSLVELVLVLSELTEDENEIFATVDHMVGSGSVRLKPFLGSERIPEAY